MAKKKSNKKKTTAAVRRPYPWDQWLNPARTRSITIAADKFRPPCSVMTQQIYNCAKRRGLKVSLSVVGDSIKIVSVDKIRKKSAAKKKAAV